MSTSFLTGLGVALVTPFDKDGEVDYMGLGRLLEHVGNQVDYLVLFGTTGESITLTSGEKSSILNYVLENKPREVPLVYGLGGNNTRALKEELISRDFKGISAILSVSPAYVKPSQRGIFQHYTELANHSPLPIILYNVPGRTASNISSQTTIELSKHPQILGIKEASGDLEQAISIASGINSDFLLISGDDLLTLPLMSIGARGLISVLANAYPAQFKRMMSSYESGNTNEAMDSLYPLARLNPLMYEEGNPVGIKQLLCELKICENHVRLPLAVASEQLALKIKGALI